MDTRVEELISAIGKLREFSHSQDDLKQIKLILNRIFPDKDCANFIYTINTDKLPFGCIVFPVFRQNTISDFLITGEVKYVSDYEVEIDSKMFDYGLTDEEVVAVILFNIHNMTASLAPMENVREAIDDFFSDNGNQLIIRSSVQYQAILNLGLVDALNQVSSCLYLPDDVVSDAFLDDLGVDCFKAAIDKLYQQIPDCNNEASRLPKLTILNWALRLYDDVDKERIPALRLLDKVKSITASVLYTNRINAAINALNRIDTDLFVSESVQQVFTESKRRGGLIASLKYNGLRDIENDLYMFQLMAKNAETESEVLYALKQINARLAILDDYIRENPNDPEIDRWIAVKMEYIEIRDVLAKKKLRKRSYGIFVDYDALDKLDDESTNEAALNEAAKDIPVFSKAEKEFNIKIKSGIKNFIKSNPSISNKYGKIDGEEYEVRAFMSLDEKSNYYIEKPLNYFLKLTKGKMIPIAVDSGSNYYCANNESGAVYYWSHDGGENDFSKIASNIKKFASAFK